MGKDKKKKKKAEKYTIQVNEDNDHLTVLLEEYRSLRDEVISLQEFSRQNITTTYAGVGVLGAILPFIIEFDLQLVLFIFPVFFYSISLTSTKYALAGINIGKYIQKVITPKIIKCLRENNENRDFEHIFSWEKKAGLVKKYGFLMLPANGAHYWITLFSAVLCVVAYFAFPPTSLPSNWIIIILSIMNILMFLYTAIVGLYAAYSR